MAPSACYVGVDVDVSDARLHHAQACLWPPPTLNPSTKHDLREPNSRLAHDRTHHGCPSPRLDLRPPCSPLLARNICPTDTCREDRPFGTGPISTVHSSSIRRRQAPALTMPIFHVITPISRAPQAPGDPAREFFGLGFPSPEWIALLARPVLVCTRYQTQCSLTQPPPVHKSHPAHSGPAPRPTFLAQTLGTAGLNG